MEMPVSKYAPRLNTESPEEGQGSRGVRGGLTTRLTKYPPFAMLIAKGGVVRQQRDGELHPSQCASRRAGY